MKKATVGLIAVLWFYGCGGGGGYQPMPYPTQNPYGYNYGNNYGYNNGYNNGYNTYNNPNLPIANVPTGAVVGKVVDQVTKLGLADVEVSVYALNPPIKATTGADGSFTLTNIPQGSHVLYVQKQNYMRMNGSGSIVALVKAGNTTSITPIELIKNTSTGANMFLTAFSGVEYPKRISLSPHN